MENIFSDKLFNVLIRFLVDDGRVLPSMVIAAEHDEQIRREIEYLMMDELYPQGGSR